MLLPIIILLVLDGIIQVANGQYGNCDYYQNVAVGKIYQVFSPGYERNANYTGGTNCRWAAQTSAGYQIVLNCKEMALPYSTGCRNDKLVISRSGSNSLSDGQSACGTPFFVQSYLNQMTVALLSPSNSYGGRFRCEMYAVNTCKCGSKKQTRIVGGTETLANEFPSMAALIKLSTREVCCGATIIAEYYLLTAAHCVNVDGKYAADLAVLVGDHDYKSNQDTQYASLYEVESIVRHQDYSSNKHPNDIAVVKTKKLMQFNDGVSPVCLPFKYQMDTFVGRILEAAGWGTLEFGGPVSSKLMKVPLNVVDISKCATAYPNSITTSQVCTYTSGKDTCNLDSGGPLFYTDNGTLYEIGIISYGTACASSKPSVNTMISQYLEWIRQRTPNAVYCER